MTLPSNVTGMLKCEECDHLHEAIKDKYVANVPELFEL